MTPPCFDRVARPYRWLEYLALGPLLARTRNHFLPALSGCRRALILGDGDGRFTARLLARNPRLQVEAVDSSFRMLALLTRRAHPHAHRLRTHHADALTFTPACPPDLIVTHFFLDCLTQPQLDALVDRLATLLPAQALWLLSEFRIPPGALAPLVRLYVRALYLVFRILTGLRVTRLPDHAAPLLRAGLVPLATSHRLFGALAAELWHRPGPKSYHRSMPTETANPPDPQPGPEPIAPSLPAPDPGVFHHDVQPAQATAATASSAPPTAVESTQP